MASPTNLYSALRARAAGPQVSWKGSAQAVTLHERLVPVFPAEQERASSHEWQPVFPAARVERRKRSVLLQHIWDGLTKHFCSHCLYPRARRLPSKAIWCYVKRENKKIPKLFIIAFGIWRTLKLSLRGFHQRLEND